MTEMIGTRPALAPEIVELPERQAAVVWIEGKADELPRLIGEAFQLTAQAIGASRAEIAGHPFARYFGFGDRIQAEVGFPFTGTLVPADRVRQATLPGGRTVTATYVGPYDGIGSAWEEVQGWLVDHKLDQREPPWEAYLTGPDEPGPPVTEIFFPIR